MKQLGLGIDIGSTTVKTVVLDGDIIIESNYQRHFSLVKETVINQMEIIACKYPDHRFKVAVTGSAGLGLAQNAELDFVQEVYAAFIGVNHTYSDSDVVIELGGEDAKIIFLTGGVEQRMNGTCAGGTGAFIDQMATLLDVEINELDELSLKAGKKYPIASRCGVFAKSDIQPLLNQGAEKSDIAASIFQAVVDQTITGLAQGREIKGKVLFLGGPLSFMKGLRNTFIETLKLDEEHAIFPLFAKVFMALGCAYYASTHTKDEELSSIISRIANSNKISSIITCNSLFNSKEEYEEFKTRHSKSNVQYADLMKYQGKAYLGIDAGSTTTKLVLLNDKKEILYSYYDNNKGRPLDLIAEQLKIIYTLLPDDVKIVSSAVTGYGEELIKKGLGIDYGIVETMAHFKAASHFNPEVDFIIDIGGQDIKCFKIRNKAIDNIILNEACSSGCGSFIQTFANALGYSIDDFVKIGLFAKNPVDLGSRCTVFMNSSVKQAQKEGASIGDIASGLSMSIIKNAIYKVIRAHDVEELGKNIVAQGGTFMNDAVLRSFEMELGREVIRPTISGLMGAYGAAIYAVENEKESTSLIDNKSLQSFNYKTNNTTCKGCTAHCSLDIIQFSTGQRFISGNRCDRMSNVFDEEKMPSLYEYKQQKLNELRNLTNNKKIAKVGIPFVLNFYDQLPLFATFFNELGFEVIITNESTRKTYYLGQQTIPSDTVCYPAKLIHGHIEELLQQNVDFIFYPCQTYNFNEGKTDNHYNCPVVAYYPELLKGNNKKLNDYNFIYPYIDLNNLFHCAKTLTKAFGRFNLKEKDVYNALEKGYQAQIRFYLENKQKALEYISLAREKGKNIIVLAGRPYHLDPEINHGIHKYISALGLCVLSEDAVSMLSETPDMQILNQWTYHGRLFKAAKYVAENKDFQMVQLISFGCGMDAITSDEVRRILEDNDKLYTQIKIDEISNLGASKIRLRSLLAAIEEKKERLKHGIR